MQGLQKGIEVAKKLGGLVRIFPVTKPLGMRNAQVEAIDVTRFQTLAAHVGVDHGVVVGTHSEPTGSEGLPLRQRGFSSILQDLSQGAVIVHGGDDDHVLEVFGGASNQCDATDVNLLHDLRLRRTACHGGLKRVQVHHHEVDCRQGVFLHLTHVGLVASSPQDSTKDLGVQGLHASAEDRRVVGDGLHGDHFGAHGLDGCLGASRRVNGDVQLLQGLHDGLKPFFVKHGNEG